MFYATYFFYAAAAKHCVFVLIDLYINKVTIFCIVATKSKTLLVNL